VDATARRDFWRTLIDYDAFGRTLWKTHVWNTTTGKGAVDETILASS